MSSAANSEAVDLSIDFSVEELVAVSSALDLPHLPGIGPDPLGGVEPAIGSAVIDAARRALVARRMFTVDGESFSVDSALKALFELACSPGIVGRAVIERSGITETRYYYAVPDVMIEHSVVIGAVHRLTPYATEALLARMLEFVELAERPAAVVEPFDVTRADLARCAEALEGGDDERATAAISGPGSQLASAAAFVDALRARARSASVTILHRPDETHLEGGELAWIDAGDSGLWLTPVPDEEAQDEPAESEPETVSGAAVKIEPTTAANIASALLSYLPGDS